MLPLASLTTQQLRIISLTHTHTQLVSSVVDSQPMETMTGTKIGMAMRKGAQTGAKRWGG